MKRRGIKTNIWSSLAGLELYTIPSLLFLSCRPHFVILTWFPRSFLRLLQRSIPISIYLKFTKHMIRRRCAVRLWKIALETQTGEYFFWIEIHFMMTFSSLFLFFIVNEDHLKDTW